jgi:hypothetical protein
LAVGSGEKEGRPCGIARSLLIVLVLVLVIVLDLFGWLGAEGGKIEDDNEHEHETSEFLRQHFF